MGELTVFITCVSSAGSQLRVFAQLNPDEYASLDASISIVHPLLDSSVLSTPFGVQSGEMVMVRSGTTSAVRWLRARVLDVSDTEHGRLTVQYVDYGSKESVYFTHVCSGRLPVLNNILCQPALAKEFVLADVVAVGAVWSDTAVRFVESVVMGQMVQALLLPTNTDGLMQIRVLLPPDNAVSVADQMCKLSLAQPAPAYQTTPITPALYQSAPPSFPPSNPAHTTFQPAAPSFQQATVAPPVFQAYYQQHAPAFTPRALQTPTLSTAATRWQQPAAPAPAVGEQLAMRVKDIASQPPQHGMQLQVTICHYTDSPAKFSIRSHQREPELRQLLAELQQYCQQLPAQPVPCVEPGGVCLSTSQQSHAPQGQFLRAVITQVDNNIVKVYWVDHGFDEPRYVSELRAMPLRFARTAILAHRVALAGLSAYTPAAAGPQQLFRDITAGRQLTCRYQSKEHPNHVELLDSGVSVLELLVRHGVYVPRQSSAPAVRPPGFSASQQLTSSAVDQLTAGAVLDVLVVSVSAIDNVYVRPASHQLAVEQLHAQMSTALSSLTAVPLTAEMAKPGTVCAVRRGSVFRRAQLVSAGRREVKVLLMDVGTSEMIPISSALLLDDKFSLVPPQVVCCFLSGLETQHGTADQVRFLESLVQGSPRLSCRVVSVRAGKPVLHLTDMSRSAPRDFNALLRDHIVNTAGAASNESPSVSPTSLVAVVNSPKVELGSVESIVVMHVESASQFFGQLASFDADDLYNMEEAMQKLYGTGRARPLSTATVGTFCVSKYSDTYYRAKVVAKTDDRVTVEYIDYGNRETKSLSQIYPLSSNFTKLPQLGVFCSLIGGSALPVDGFRNVVMDQTVDVMLHSLLSDKYRVLLPPSVTNNATILAQLKRIGYVPKVMGDSSSSTSSSVKPTTNATKPAVSSTSLATGTLSQQSVPLGVYKDAEIVHVVDPGEFYLQLKEQFDCIDQLQEQLAAEYGTSSCRLTAAAAAGQLVAARHSSDGGWYRGRVLATDKQQQVSVFFVDYGDTQSLAVGELRPLLVQYATLPAQAIRCSVDSKPADGLRWTDTEVSKFSGDVLEQRMLVCVDEVQRGGTSLVTLAQAHNIKPGSTASRRSPQRQESRADQDLNWRETKSKSPVEARHESAAPRRPSDPVVSNGDAGFQGRMRMDDPSEFAPTPRTPSAVAVAGGDTGGWGHAEESQSAADGRSQQENKPVRAAAADSWGQQNSGGDRKSVRDDGGFAGRSDSRTVKRQDSNPGSWAQSGGGNTNGGDKGPERTAGGASSVGRGQSGSSGSWASKPVAAASSVEVAAHSGTIQLRTLSPGSSVKATPTWVSGLSDFYLHPLVDDQHPFCRMMQQLQLFYSGLQLPADARETNVQLGKAVVARGTDGVWYRGLVQRLDGEKVGVLFPDYGTRMMEEKNKLKRIKPEFCQMPAHAYRCRFADVEPAGGTWKKMDKPSLSKYFCEEVQMVSVSVDEKHTYVDVLCNGKSSRDKILADGLAVKAGQKLQLKGIGVFVGLDTLFRVTAELSVYVAYISSTDCFYVQLNDNVDQLTKLETDIETFANDCKECCSLVSAGEICLAPFEEVYYRSVISRVNGDHASVYFVDYGNTEQVAVADLLECPISLVDVPAQAVPCTLTGVAVDKTQQFRDRATEQELKAVIDAVFDTYLEVTLLEGISDVNKQLGGNGKVSTSAIASSTSAIASSTSASASSTSATAPSASSTAPSTSATAPSASATAPSASTNAPSTSATAPSASATSDEFSIVVVCYSVDPGEFYVQYADAAATQRLDDVMNQLEQYYTQLTEGQDIVDKVEVGAVVAAPYSEDGGVYRARVTAVNCADNPGSCQLYFIDYGNSESVPRDQLRQLSALLLAPAAMSQPCRLAVQPTAGKLWDKAAVDSFQQLVGDGQLQLVRLNSCGDVWTVELRDPACKSHVAEELIKQGHAQPDIVQLKQQECGETGLSALSVGSLVDAAVVYSLSPTDFWVQLNADSDTLDVLMDRLSTSELLAVTDTPTAGQLLVARYSEDEALYRARVVSVDGEVSVLFIDYGNQELVARDALYACPEQLAGTPPLALHCRLPLQATQGWSDEALETFNQLTGQEEQLLRLELLEAPQDGATCRVNLYDGQTDVAFSLVGAGYGQPESAVDVTTETPTDAVDVTTETPTAAVDVTVETPTAAVDVTTETTDAGDESVFVSHVNSPWDLYVQSADSAALDSLMERLSTEDLPALSDPAAVGQLVASVYSLDDAMYRARVQQLTADGAVQLLYVDYGNGEETASDGLLQLPEELVAVPWQARRCRLAVEPLSDDHAAATDRLRQAVCDTEEPLVMRRLPGSGDDVTPVSLMTSDGRDAATLLVAAGVCRRATAVVTCLPPSLPVSSGQPTELLVAHIESPGHFYVQLRRDTAALDELMEQLEAAAGKLQPLRAPAPGQLCVARYPDDQAWYRSRVLDVTGETARVQFVDYGNCSELPTAELLNPPSELLLLPELSRRCRLPARPPSPATSWDAGATAVFAEISTRADNTYTACLLPDDQTDDVSVAPLKIQGRPVVQLLQEAGVQLVSEEQLHRPASRRASAEDKIVPGHISYRLLEDQEEEDSSVYESALHSPADDCSPPLQSCVSPDEHAVAAAIYSTDELTCAATFNEVKLPARSMSASPRPGSGRTSPEDKVVPGHITHGLIVLPEPDTENIVIAATGVVVEQSVSAETTGCLVEEHDTKEKADGLAENAATEAVEEGGVTEETVEEVEGRAISEEIVAVTISMTDTEENELRMAPNVADAPVTDITADVTAGVVCDELVEEPVEAEVGYAAAEEERLAETVDVDGVLDKTTEVTAEIRKDSVDTDTATSDEDSGSEQDGEVVGSDSVQDESAEGDVCDASSSGREETALKEANPVMSETEHEVSGNDDVDAAGDQGNGTRSLVEDTATGQQVISVSGDTEVTDESEVVDVATVPAVCAVTVEKTVGVVIEETCCSDAVSSVAVKDSCGGTGSCEVGDAVKGSCGGTGSCEVGDAVKGSCGGTGFCEADDAVKGSCGGTGSCEVGDDVKGSYGGTGSCEVGDDVKGSCGGTGSCEADDAVKGSCGGTASCEVGGDVVKDSCDGTRSCEVGGDAAVNRHMSATTK